MITKRVRMIILISLIMPLAVMLMVLKKKAAVAFNDMVSYKYGGHSTGYNKYTKLGLIIHEGKILRNDPTGSIFEVISAGLIKTV